MRISDWSSDVCSSDLPDPLPNQKRGGFMNREALIAAALAQLWTASALAQAIPSDSAGGVNSGNAAEDVTEQLVTAQKRSERPQVVPLPVTVWVADQLRSSWLQNTDGPGKLVPGH